MPGPPKKPTALQMVHGNPSKRPLPVSEPLPERMASLEPPEELSDVGKAVWRRNAEEMDRLGLLTSIDREAFTRYCWVAEQWHKAKQRVETEGPILCKFAEDGTTVVSTYANPAWYMERGYAERLDKMESAFGMNPSSRSRIRLDGGEGAGGVIPKSDPFSVPK